MDSDSSKTRISCHRCRFQRLAFWSVIALPLIDKRQAEPTSLKALSTWQGSTSHAIHQPLHHLVGSSHIPRRSRTTVSRAPPERCRQYRTHQDQGALHRLSAGACRAQLPAADLEMRERRRVTARRQPLHRLLIKSHRGLPNPTSAGAKRMHAAVLCPRPPTLDSLRDEALSACCCHRPCCCSIYPRLRAKSSLSPNQTMKKIAKVQQKLMNGRAATSIHSSSITHQQN